MSTALVCKQGATLRRPFTVTQAGSAVDLTGATIAAELRADVDQTIAATWTVTVTNAAAGTGEIALATSGLKPRAYVFDVRFTMPDTTVLFSDTGTLTIQPAVTRG